MLHRERKPRFLPFRIPNPESRIPAPPMHAYVYKSLRKADTYVYLAEREDFERLPEPLRAQLEPLRFVLDVALVPGRKLAREDVEAVRSEEHTSELQSLMRISYAVLCLQKQKKK